MRRFFGSVGTIALLCLTNVLPIHAQPAVLTVSTLEGRGLNSKAINVQVWAGRATAIDFSRVNERITQIFLADPSRFTYATDTATQSGQATTVFLRQIQPLKFPHLTRANVTNLFIKTKTEDGTARLYTFNLLPGENSPKYNGLSIAAVSGTEQQRYTLEVGLFRQATLNDIERGLISAVRRGYTPASDPIVVKIREFLALARNTSDKSLVEIAQSVNLSLRVLTELGLMGIEDTATPTRTVPKPSLNQPLMHNSIPKTELIRFRE
jgi:hypothetical protein